MEFILGTVESVDVDVQIQKRDDTFYTGTKLIYTNDFGEIKAQPFHKKALEFNARVAADLKKIKKGDKIQLNYVVNDRGFRDFKSITLQSEVVHHCIPSKGNIKAKPASTGYSTAGVIKGNCVTNAVSLAIARAGSSTNLDDLKKAADDVLQLHGYLEAKDVMAEISKYSEEKATEEKAPEVKPVKKKKAKKKVVEVEVEDDDEDDDEDLSEVDF